MRDLRKLNIPKISEQNLFEELCVDIWRESLLYEFVNLNGSPGQSQKGVDIFGRYKSSNTWFGIQCKVRNTNNRIYEAELISELEKAATFNPELTEYIICTTLSRDSYLQKLIRNHNESGKYKFKIESMFWDDIEELLKKESNLNLFIKYYHNFIADNTSLGHSIGKLINIEIGDNGKYDTRYEMMIGKIPCYKEKNFYNVDYYRDAYFLINFHLMKAAVFKLPAYEGDLENAFLRRYDSFRIAKWINSIKNLDDFIYSEGDNYKSSISEDEIEEYLRKYCNEENE